MISGGQHKNIFAVNLGQMQLDKDIKNLSNEVSKLQKELNDLTEGENGDSEHAGVVKEVTKLETEIDIIKSKLLDVERQIKAFKENSSEGKA
jgi:predicted  nucleic acid-binding Zn-ribbon protein